MNTLFQIIRNTQKLKAIVITLVIILGCLAIYIGYTNAIKRIDPQVFDFDDTIEWGKENGKIYQLKSYWDLNNYLPTKDIFKQFDLSMNVKDLTIGGVVFKRTDQNNFYMLLYDVPRSALSILDIQDGKAIPVIRRNITHKNPIKLRLVVNDKSGELYVNDLSMGTFKLDERFGRFGLLLKGEEGTKVRFSDIHVKGTLVNGKAIDTIIDQPDVNQSNLIFWQILIFIYLMVSGFILTKVYSGFLEGLKLNGFSAGFIHLIISVFLFIPFVIKGHIYVVSGDNYSQILPLLFYSKQVFLNIITGKSLDLWNPYVFNGMPFFSNHWQMIFTPLNWPIFLFPDKYLLWALTLRHLFELFFTGLFAYKFFRIELKNNRWAMYCSIVFQLCSVMLFSYTVFPASSLYMLMIIFLYLVWSSSQRKGLLNYIYLTLVIYMILTSANFAFIFYAGLSLMVISLYWILTHPKDQQIKASLFLMISGVTGVLLAMVRLLPCAIGIKESNRLAAHFSLMAADRLPLLSRLFMPDIVGVAGTYKAHASSFGRIFGSNAHSQIIFFVYFGIIAAVLLIIGMCLRSDKNRQMSFWKGYVLVTFGYVLFVEPLNAVFSFVVFPFNHYTYNIILLPIGVCSLIGFVGKNIEQGVYSPRYLVNRMLPILGVIIIYILIILSGSFKSILSITRMIVLIGFLCWVLYLFFNILKRGQKIYTALLINAFEVIIWVGILTVSILAVLQPVLYKEYLFIKTYLPSLYGLMLVFITIKMYCSKNMLRKICIRQILIGLVVIVCSYTILSSSLIENFLLFSFEKTAYYSYMGILFVKLLLILMIIGHAFMMLKNNLISKSLFVTLIILVTIIDLFAFNIGSRDVAAPSVRGEMFKEDVYPYAGVNAKLLEQMDRINYRAHYLHRADLTTNENIALGIASYTGVVGYMSEQFGKFIGAFGYSSHAIAIFPENATNNPRFLDLSAVKYEIYNNTVLRERSNTLSRMNLVYDYQVIEDEQETLQALVKASFNPKLKVLLSELPELEKTTESGRFVQFVDIEQKSNDEVFVHVELDRSAVLLFNDSYHEGWQAFVNGKNVKIIPANFNFMGIFLEPGTYDVTFKFKPNKFFTALKCSAIGLFIFVGIIFISRKRNIFYGLNRDLNE